MDLGLAGDTVVILGSARGLGLAIARAFAAEGAGVGLVDRDDEVVAAAEVVRATTGRDAIGVVADARELGQVREARDLLVERFGRVDHLVYAAAVGSGGFGFPFWNVGPDRWGRVLDVNLVGAANAAHAFAPGMAEARRGSILFLASVAGQIGSQTDPPYSASKAGLLNFTRCAARDLAPSGVRVNALCPGMVKTALNRSVHAAWAAGQPEADRLDYEAWADAKVKAVVPLGRWQTEDDIASMAVFLASPRAGSVTGQAINVDGGYVMH